MKDKPRLCDRCGKTIINQIQQIRIGGRENELHEVCTDCQSCWHNHYMVMLDKLHLSGKEWNDKWEEFFYQFLRDGKKKEKVTFS